MTEQQQSAMRIALDWYDNGNENREEFQGMIRQILEQAQKQEPVAIADGTFNHNCPVGIELYTATTRQPWVGLTDEEIYAEFGRECWGTVTFADGTRGIALDKITVKEFARAIEAKLREKNGGAA